MEKRDRLPEFCLSVLPGTNECIIIKRGESGYYRTDYPKNFTKEIVRELNEERGISEAEQKAMEFGSMFGWESPAADPETWEKAIARKEN